MAEQENWRGAEIVYGGAGAGRDGVAMGGGAGAVRRGEDVAGAQGTEGARRDRGIRVPDDVVSASRGRRALLLVNKKMQAGAGVRAGEKARIWLEPDLEEREILLPEELKRELNSDRGLRKWFDGLSDSMRREIGKWAARAEERREPAEARGKDGGAADAGDGGGTGAAAGAEGDLSAAAAGAGGVVCADADAKAESSAGHLLL